MERLGTYFPITDSERKWEVSAKIEFCKKKLKELRNDELEPLIELLESVRNLLELRNEIVHGRIENILDKGLILKSGRPNIPDRDIEYNEVFNLAETLMSYVGVVKNKYMYATIRAINEKANT